MNLDEYIAEETRRLAAFNKFWQARNQTEPSEFPAEMEPGEWDEQLNLWDWEKA